MRFLKTESYKKGVVLSTGLNIVAKGIAFLNTLIIAYFFGANAGTDIYFGVVSVALIITSTINGIDFLVLIPESMRLREQENENASQKFINFFLYSYAAIGLLIISVIFISPTFFYSIFTSFDTELLFENKQILYLSSIIIFFQLVNNLLNAVLTSHKFFTISILTGLVNSVFAITLTGMFHRQLGIEGTIAGLCIGYFINFVLLVIVLYRSLNWKFLQVGWVTRKSLWINILLMEINILPLWIRNAIGLYLLSGLANGVVTSMNLGQQLSLIPEVLIVSQLLSIAGIKFSELFAKKQMAELNATFLKLCVWGIYVTSFIGFGFFLFSTEIVYILYSRSNVGDAARQNIETTFCFLILCLPAKFSAALSTNILTASQNIRATFFAAVATHTIVTSAIIFLITHFGLVGYLIGINVHFYLFLFLFYPIMKKVLPAIEYSRVFTIFALNALNNGVAYLIVYSLFYYRILVVDNSYVKLIIGLALYGLLVTVANEITRVNKQLTIKELYIYGKRTLYS